MKTGAMLGAMAMVLACGALPAVATTKTQDQAMQDCLKWAHAKNVEDYCAAKRGTKIQQECVKKAADKAAKRECLKGNPRGDAPAAPTPEKK